MLCELMETPLRRFLSFKSPLDREKDSRAQYEAVALIKRMVRTNEAALTILRNDTRVKKSLSLVIEEGQLATNGAKGATVNSSMNIMSYDYPSNSKSNKKQNSPKIVDLVDLKTHEMARVAAWGLGGVVAWKPKQPGQKGLRILSFDGGVVT